MKAKVIFIATAIILLAAHQKCFSQEAVKNDSIYFITTKDGTTINGTLHEKNEKQISINTRNFGTVTISRDSIRQMQVLAATSYKKGKFFFPNPNATRYFFGPSAIPLGQGEGYFQNTYIFLNSLNYGVTKNISVGAGIDVITPFIKDGGGPIAIATLKAGFQVVKNFYVAGTTVLVHTPYLGFANDKNESIYLVEDAAFTIGNPDINFTAGIIYGLIDGDAMPGPSFTFSGMARVTPRLSFVSENWIFPETHYQYDFFTGTDSVTGTSYEGFVSYGVRFMSQKIAVDFGFINNGDISKDIFIGVPYVDFVVKF